MGIRKKFSLKRIKPFPGNKRRQQRSSCDVTAEFADSGRNMYSCKIVDISESGIGIVASTNLVVGNVINITRPAIEAEVIWALDYKAGLRILR
ncbi:MAG: PilZ domain-containing protein [Dissulfurispiraceae bacterium]|jgi:hypothetical protein